jgi:hypothetical protein
VVWIEVIWGPLRKFLLMKSSGLFYSNENISFLWTILIEKYFIEWEK